jgi:hypothetical protein
MTDRARPRRWVVALGPAMAFAGFGLGLFATLHGSAVSVGHYQRVVQPSDGQLNLAGGTHYTVYYEARSKVGGIAYHGPASVRLDCALRDPAGAGVALSDQGGRSDYTLGAYSGVSVYDFRSAAPGAYALNCSHSAAGQSIVLAVGGDGAGSAAGWGLAGIFASVGLGIAVLAVHQRRRAAWPAANPAGGPPAPRPPPRLASRALVPALVAAWALLQVATFAWGGG